MNIQVFLDQKDVAKLLIERGADVNMKVSSGKTALWYTGWFCGICHSSISPLNP